MMYMEGVRKLTPRIVGDLSTSGVTHTTAELVSGFSSTRSSSAVIRPSRRSFTSCQVGTPTSCSARTNLPISSRRSHL